MAIRITDEFSCIKVENNGDALYIHKNQIKAIDAIRNDTVRIDIGEGHLRHLFISMEDVTVPAGLFSAFELRDTIKVMLDSGRDQENGYFDMIIEFLTRINIALDTANSRSLLGDPTRIDESTAGVVYYGYALEGAGALPTDPHWAIKRTTHTGDEFVTDWANGDKQFDNIWDGRTELPYLPL